LLIGFSNSTGTEIIDQGWGTLSGNKDVLIYRKGYAFAALDKRLDKRFIDKIFESRNEVSLKQ
jgi:hypothetical protein